MIAEETKNLKYGDRDRIELPEFKLKNMKYSYIRKLIYSGYHLYDDFIEAIRWKIINKEDENIQVLIDEKLKVMTIFADIIYKDVDDRDIALIEDVIDYYSRHYNVSEIKKLKKKKIELLLPILKKDGNFYNDWSSYQKGIILKNEDRKVVEKLREVVKYPLKNNYCNHCKNIMIINGQKFCSCVKIKEDRYIFCEESCACIDYIFDHVKWVNNS